MIRNVCQALIYLNEQIENMVVTGDTVYIH